MIVIRFKKIMERRDITYKQLKKDRRFHPDDHTDTRRDDQRMLSSHLGDYCQGFRRYHKRFARKESEIIFEGNLLSNKFSLSRLN